MSEVEAISFDEVECGKKVAEYLFLYSGARSVSSGGSRSKARAISWNSPTPPSLARESSPSIQYKSTPKRSKDIGYVVEDA